MATSYPEAWRAPGAPQAGGELEGRRQAVLDRLTQAFADDSIPLESYESRVGIAQNALSVVDLDRALDGMGGSPSWEGRRESRETAPRGERSANRVDHRIIGSSSVACIMGERQLSGDWLSGDQVSSFTLMGSTRIDLRDTALPPGRLKIDAFCLMGETKIIVPRGLAVRFNAFPFMGEANVARDVQRRLEPGMPYVEISGLAVMGSLVVVAMD